MDEWNPKLAWLIAATAALATVVVAVLAWPAARPQIQAALHAPAEADAARDAGGGEAPTITESRTVGDSRVHRID